MRSFLLKSTLFAIALSPLLTMKADTLPLLTSGHTDVGVNYEDNSWDLHVHAESVDKEYEPDAVWLKVGNSARTVVPSSQAFSFLGNPGAPVWILPSTHKPDLLFLGLGTEEMTSGTFSNNTIRLALRSVEGPGAFIMYQLDTFGLATVSFNSRDGIGANDVILLTTGGHKHANWAFTAPGKYRIGLQASGVLTATGETSTSQIAEYLFDVGEQSPCYYFTQEHVDLLSIQWNAASNTLSLMASDDDHGGALYASNQCVVVCPENMKFTLPGGTPLGQEGAPLWILPQNPYAGVPYVGVSCEAITPGTFIDPMTIYLTRVEGPGHFIAWQAVGFGNFDIKMDTRDGISENDKIMPFVGGHEHQNLGFTTSGVYRVYFQVSGRRPGEITNIVSAETPFTFHILPLKPFENWVATNWPCECNPAIATAGADPDHDNASNLLEYAVGTDPKKPSDGGQLIARLVAVGGQTFAEISFTRAKTATDCSCEVVAANMITATQWQPLAAIHSIIDEGPMERIMIRDAIPVGMSNQRYYQLRISLHAP